MYTEGSDKIARDQKELCMSTMTSQRDPNVPSTATPSCSQDDTTQAMPLTLDQLVTGSNGSICVSDDTILHGIAMNFYEMDSHGKVT